MSKTSDLLTACFFRKRWRVSASTTNASCTATAPTPTDSTGSKIQLENFWYSISNTTAAAYTVDVQVRGAAFTVLSTTREIAAVGVPVNRQFLGMGFPSPKIGVSLNVNLTPPASSVLMSVTAAGWIEDSNG